MRLQQAWRQAALAVVAVSISTNVAVSLNVTETGWSSHRKLNAREKTRDLWNHGFDSYMNNAFPLDELMPLSCIGRGPDWENPHNFGNNDVAGNFSLTLIDVLDTFVVLQDPLGFERAVRNIVEWVSFDVNTRPQIFETTIRVLGGLLSGHIFASDASSQFYLPWYEGELLEMAHDLGKRMLPAFATPTGIPFARLNLRHGVPYGESHDTCTAGAGSLILEFGTLSRLTGDDRFEEVAYKAFFALWNRKSDIGLVGNTINAWTGKWLAPEVTGIGAGVDSFFEYAFKWFVLSGEVEFLDVWHEAYAAIMRYSRGIDGFWFRSADIHSGNAMYNTVDSLSAFWPGLQVLAGDVENAIKSHLIYWNLWKRHSGLPEVWDIKFMQAVATQYPLRPEFVESTYYLYRATKDSLYLDVGERILRDLIQRSKVECGLTGISDLRINKQDDRMESFVLSETLKYLYLLFDEANPIHKDDSNFVFTTEGHILTLESKYLKGLSPARRRSRRVENLQCPAYRSIRVGANEFDDDSGLITGILYRPDIDYARALVGASILEEEENWWSVDGHCDIPSADLYSYDFILSPDGKHVPEDFSPSSQKLYEVSDGYVVQNVTGIRTHIVRRLDGKGYDIVKCKFIFVSSELAFLDLHLHIRKVAQQTVRSGQIVYLSDPALQLASVKNDGTVEEFNDGFPADRVRDIALRFYLHTDPTLQVQSGDVNTGFKTVAFTASFGGDALAKTSFLFGGYKGVGSRIVYVSSNNLGCSPYRNDDDTPIIKDMVVLAHRGSCTFLEKLMHAKRAGATGVVVVSDTDLPFNPSAEAEELQEFAEDALGNAVLVVVTRSAGAEIEKLLNVAKGRGTADLIVSAEPEGQDRKMGTADKRVREESRKHANVGENIGKILYLNGHPLLNTRLLT
ncbi:hypothetical protein EW145_g47 [Phellinidium pouzarii]|uniref:alpha-1,2-Mannosidase n=1 Tax=Phellinidium pouzarii TaxID=167371 RepID=A0A4S4LQK1_9AGAM|nr:hypothetical protein EW145_g47 [Phellinidium pouzarii]